MDEQPGHPPNVNLQGNGDQVVLTPNRNSHNPRARYLTSSSAKRRKRKEADCKFCDERIMSFDLLKHLSEEKNCQSLYMKTFKVNSLDQLILKLFSCEVCCERKQINLKNHLLQNQNCLERYRLKFGEESVEKIHKKVAALKRAALPSRSNAARQLDYVKIKKKREEAKLNMTTVDSLNMFRSNTMIANYKMCVICRSNFSEHGARQLKEDEELFERFKLGEDTNRNLRRFQLFFVCNHCDKDTEEEDEGKFDEPEENEEEIVDVNVGNSVSLGEIASGDVIEFFPANNAEQTDNDEVEQTLIRMMLPNNLDAIKSIKHLEKIRSRSDKVSKVFETGTVTRSTISAIYENEVQKYKKADESGDIYNAVIKDFHTKELSYVEKVRSCSRITGSKDWIEKQKMEMKFRQEQFGSLFITLKIELPRSSIDVIATCLLQEGLVITIDKVGSANGEFTNVYTVHMDHLSCTDCSEECENKVDLRDFINNHELDMLGVDNKLIGTYVSSIHLKLNAFCRSVIQAPASGLYSENFHLLLIFDTRGQASIVGCIWPRALEEINFELAQQHDEIGKQVELVQFVERNISTSTDPRLIRSDFSLSDEEANTLGKLVEEQQVNICEFEDDDEFETSDLPSLETIVKEKCSFRNLEAAAKFRKIMVRNLEMLSIEERRSFSTWNWLEKVWLKVTGDISDDFNSLKINFEEEMELVFFEIDERLSQYLEEYNESPLTATYHYAISCCSPFGGFPVVLRRLRIKECFIKPYNPLFLKCSSPVVVQLVNTTNMFENLLSCGQSWERDEQVDPQMFFSHKLVSMAEAVSLFDKTKKRVGTSTTVEFCNAKYNRKQTMKKVAASNNENFRIEGCKDEYQIQESNISRHFNRRNGDLLLAESVLWYEYQGKEKSKELSKTYADLEIPLSDVKCASGEGVLPTYLLCTNGDVLKKRSKQKIMLYPKPKANYDLMYSKCLLFYPLTSENELLGPGLKEKFAQLDKEGLGTIVECNERKLFKMKQIPTSNKEQSEELTMDVQDDPLDFLLEALEDVEDQEDPLDLLLQALED